MELSAGQQGSLSPGLANFLQYRVAGEVCCGGAGRGGLDPRDATVALLLADAGLLLSDCAARLGASELAAALRSRPLPSLCAPVEAQVSPFARLVLCSMVHVPVEAQVDPFAYLLSSVVNGTQSAADGDHEHAVITHHRRCP